MNRYYAELTCTTRGISLRYGYAFMAKGMFEARVHVFRMCKTMGIPTFGNSVWRVNKKHYAWVSERYSQPTLIDTAAVEHEAA